MTSGRLAGRRNRRERAKATSRTNRGRCTIQTRVSIELAQHSLLALEPSDSALVEGSHNHNDDRAMRADVAAGVEQVFFACRCQLDDSLGRVIKPSTTLFSCAASNPPRHSRRVRRMRCTWAAPPPPDPPPSRTSVCTDSDVANPNASSNDLALLGLSRTDADFASTLARSSGWLEGRIAGLTVSWTRLMPARAPKQSASFVQCWAPQLSQGNAHS